MVAKVMLRFSGFDAAATPADLLLARFAAKATPELKADPPAATTAALYANLRRTKSIFSPMPFLIMQINLSANQLIDIGAIAEREITNVACKLEVTIFSAKS